MTTGESAQAAAPDAAVGPHPGLGSAPRGRRRTDLATGWVMVLLWAAWLVLTAMTQPRLVTPDRLAEDLAAGRVVTWQVVEVRSDRDQMEGWAADITTNPLPLSGGEADLTAAQLGPPALAYWVDGRVGRMRIVDPALAAPGGPAPAVDRVRGAGVPEASEMRDVSVVLGLERDWPAWAAGPLGLLFLASVVLGPAPTRGTRWFWFWLVWGTLGLGVLAYAVWEVLRPAPRQGAPGAPRRLRGWSGLVVAIVGSLVLTGLVDGLADVTHWLWLVRP
ncbi:hypothetical protein [uncultured Phycicoccus sp.]|uniref:hypothetical protein n=1 Tax=uncultured Phycicoccus sp. TaxID=661422 RepID=UPI00262F42BD|nr:hypothetical protein [uncultured Phycicoccus sp.]